MMDNDHPNDFPDDHPNGNPNNLTTEELERLNGIVGTDETRAAVTACRHVPDRAEIEGLLEKFFFGPIPGVFVDRVEAEFLRIRESPDAWSRVNQDFQRRFRWDGTAWNEQFTRDWVGMTPSDLFLMLADVASANERLFPQPRMNCPAPFVGTWQQMEPVPAPGEPCLWHLGADGDFQSNSPDLPPNKRYWCLERRPGGWFKLAITDERRHGSRWALNDVVATAREITGVHLGYYEEPAFRLRRVG